MRAPPRPVGPVPPPGVLRRCLLGLAALALTLGTVPNVKGILAGDETALPADSPAARLDLLGRGSPFNAVGALAISSGGFSYKGSATAISPNWVLTAGHNLDLNDNGSPDAGLSSNFNLPGFGTYAATSFYTCPGFTGFGSQSIQRDLGLLYLATPLPEGLFFPSLQGVMPAGSEAALVGFGRSGYGNYGYTTSATLTDRRVGCNVGGDSFTPDDELNWRHYRPRCAGVICLRPAGAGIGGYCFAASRCPNLK